MDSDMLIPMKGILSTGGKIIKEKKSDQNSKKAFKKESFMQKSFQKKRKKFWKILIYLFLILIICFCFLFFFCFINNYKITEKPSKNDFVFIVCLFGKQLITNTELIKKYFYTINKFVPHSKVTFIVSEYTIIDPDLIKYKNIDITIERYGNLTFEEIEKKYNYPRGAHSYFVFSRLFIYKDYLKNHPEIKYLIISDDDTLFFKDPFLLIQKDPNTVHIMQDVYPFSKTNDLNYVWTDAWVQLNDSIKQKCGFKPFNKNLLSEGIKDIVPLNSGMMVGSSKNIIKILELLTSKYICTGTFPRFSDQGLLNYLDLSGELKELGFPIQRHNIFNGSLISCVDQLPIENFIQQMGSKHLIAIHHYQYLRRRFIKKSPILSHIFLSV